MFQSTFWPWGRGTMCSLLRTPHTIISRMEKIYWSGVDSFLCCLPSHTQSLFWKSQLTKTMLIFAKTWDLTVWWPPVSAQHRFVQSVQVRAQSRPQAQEHLFYVLNWGKHEQCFSRKYLKILHQDVIYPALFSCSATVYLHDLGQVTLWLGCRLQWADYCAPKTRRAGIFLQPGSSALAYNHP